MMIKQKPMDLSQSIIPPLLFFLVFFIAFSLLELIIIFILNRLQTKHWQFFIDFIIRAKVHYGHWIEALGAFLILLVLGLIYVYTPFFDVFRSATPTLKTFALILLLVMILIYLTTIHRMTKLALEKKIQRYIYFLVSVFLYVFILTTADQSYSAYQAYINTQFVNPAIENIQDQLDQKEKEQLLSKFRGMMEKGECEEKEFNEKEEKGIIHFIYVGKEADRSAEKEAELKLKGQLCADGENTFLLTEAGEWYWVIKDAETQ